MSHEPCHSVFDTGRYDVQGAPKKGNPLGKILYL